MAERRTAKRLYPARRDPDLEKLWAATRLRRAACESRRSKRQEILIQHYQWTRKIQFNLALPSQLSQEQEAKIQILEDGIVRHIYAHTAIAHRDECFEDVISDLEHGVLVELYQLPYFRAALEHRSLLVQQYFRWWDSTCAEQSQNGEAACTLANGLEALQRLQSAIGPFQDSAGFTLPGAQVMLELYREKHLQHDAFVHRYIDKIFESEESLLRQISLLERSENGQLSKEYIDWCSSTLDRGELQRRVSMKAKLWAEKKIPERSREIVSTGAGGVSVLLIVDGSPVSKHTVQPSDLQRMGWRQDGPAQPYWQYQELRDSTWVFKVSLDGEVLGLWTPEGDIDWSEDVERTVLEH